jgi:hypothetical protein
MLTAASQTRRQPCGGLRAHAQRAPMVPNGARVSAEAVGSMSSRSRAGALSNGRAETLVALFSSCRLEALCVARHASADIGLCCYPLVLLPPRELRGAPRQPHQHSTLAASVRASQMSARCSDDTGTGSQSVAGLSGRRNKV